MLLCKATRCRYSLSNLVSNRIGSRAFFDTIRRIYGAKDSNQANRFFGDQ